MFYYNFTHKIAHYVLDTVYIQVMLSIVMALSIRNPHLEKAVAKLAARQVIPVSKHRMAIAILKAAVQDGRGRPVAKWREQVRSFTESVSKAG